MFNRLKLLRRSALWCGGLTAIACLSNCESTNLGANSSSSDPSRALRAVAGTWGFSHMGEPTISNPDAPNPAQHAIPYAKEMKISIAADGQSSMLAAGQASEFTAEVLEETPLYIKVGVSGQPGDEAFVYDKATKLLMMPMKLEIEDSKGILPTYFKRSR